jgi:cell division protein ZapE
MDLFYSCLPFREKKRMHFHRFMAMVHQRLKVHSNQPEPLDLVAEELARECRIICFDEFAVTDIADAMILGNLFRALFARGVSLAATSNTEPKNLYLNGLQRAQFLPAIALIEKHTEVVRMDGDLDYRLRFLQQTDLFQHPADGAADLRLAEYFDAIAPDAIHAAGHLEILGRNIEYLRIAEDAIWFDFPQVCDGPRSQDDYIELARLYQCVVLSNVPQFTTLLENQARRFIALVDEFYDRRVKLVISAAVRVEQLYAGTRLAHEFGRTRSRLQEMQSLEYLHAAHRP